MSSYSYAMPARSYTYPQAPAGFPQVPFNGPPPKPAHIRVNPQDWQNGAWSMNPAFNTSSRSLASAQAWVPGQAWHQRDQQLWQQQQAQMAAAAAHNPFKRVPRPPSAEYMATRLVDNPLGLSNMIPREELYGTGHDGAAAPTPWVWNPRHLDEPAEQDSSANAQRPEPPPSSGPAPAPPTSAPPHGVPPPMYRQPPHPRDMSDPTPQNRPHAAAPLRHSSEPPAERRSSVDSLPGLDRPLDRPRQHRVHANESFTSARELQPTFSMNVVRTPERHKSRSTSAGPSPQPIYGPPRHASVDDLTNRMDHLSTHANGLSRHSSLPAPLSAPAASTSMTDVANLVDEPISLLSPLVVPSTQKHGPRPLGPSSSLNTIPEGFDSDGSTRRSPRRKSQRRSRHTSPAAPGHSMTPPQMNIYQIANVSPPAHGSEQQRGPNVTPPHPNPHNLTPPHAHPASYGPNLTPPHGQSQPPLLTPPHHQPAVHSAPHPHPRSPTSPNPLPEPPQTISRNPELRLPMRRSPPQTYRRRVRKGLWNRRGDHLTMDGFIVYAPRELAFPEELRDYPDEGYRDDQGAEIPYLDVRPELPESLPRHGNPPVQPYEHFVVYEYLQ